MSMVAVTDDNPGLAESVTDDLCRLANENFDFLTGRKGGLLHTVESGVARAKALVRGGRRPVVLLDHADRTSDTTFIVKELKKQNVQNAAVPVICDPKAAEACIRRGVGKDITLSAGACTGWRDGGPVDITGRIIWAGRGQYTGTGPLWKNIAIDLGPTAIVQSDGLWLQFTTQKMQLIDEDPFIQFGFRPQDFDVIVTKSKTHFRAVYEEIAAEILIVDAPGQCPADLSQFEYKYAPEALGRQLRRG
jgi:microcystin degradation protein MlrC